jgi:hypothetical protein
VFGNIIESFPSDGILPRTPVESLQGGLFQQTAEIVAKKLKQDPTLTALSVGAWMIPHVIQSLLIIDMIITVLPWDEYEIITAVTFWVTTSTLDNREVDQQTSGSEAPVLWYYF